MRFHRVFRCVSKCFKELPLSSAAAFIRHGTVGVALALTSLNTLEVRTGDLENAFLMLCFLDALLIAPKLQYRSGFCWDLCWDLSLALLSLMSVLLKDQFGLQGLFR